MAGKSRKNTSMDASELAEKVVGVEETIEKESSETKSANMGAFSKLGRALSEDDLTSPAVSRMLLDRIDTLTAEVNELKIFKDKYHEEDKRCAVLEEKSHKQTKFEVFYNFVLATGGIIFGAGFAVQGDLRNILFLLGIILMGGSVIIYYLLPRR